MFDQYLQQLIDNGELPGATLHVQHHGRTVFHKAYGTYHDRQNNLSTITKTTQFDVASLTKVMATLPSILWLLDNSSLKLDHSIQTYIPEFKHKEVTISHALTHTSGLAADLKRMTRNEWRPVFEEITALSLLHKPGEKVLYSDSGMILLGKVIERISGLSLSTFADTYLYCPWGLESTGFHPTDQTNIASTETYDGSYIQGVVHDEKALHLGGESGSAGLFSTSNDVGKFGSLFLYPERQTVLSEKRIRQAQKHVVGNRGLGFEVWSGKGANLSCGGRWSIGSFGHTGFTGTSLWIDPVEELVVTFLTNIVHYGRKHNMKVIRPHLHSLIHSTFIKGE
ncbi:serine hydrolase domain-containing protein [Alkalihalobacillus sp. CinArs1]|uniref:serine hydrolase domain-containing protein n=1 Tax=Alkalihalobacillus sp. CinArs1 TaxID=2995314 RepID=UPI0022DD02B0|nr:serine hydrolase domain-containing protein [Alkalihalobacillus sp. CinArs1]